MEPVVDSSRYFVLRVQAQSSNKHAYVGIGFREREAAFSLKATLQVRLSWVRVCVVVSVPDSANALPGPHYRF